MNQLFATRPVTRPAPITAVVYVDAVKASRLLERAARALLHAGYVCSGVIQRDEPRPGRNRCDRFLENIASGERMHITEDRGPGARGCHLDPHLLLAAMENVRLSLTGETDILILNKFGKSECEGGGFRPLIAEALDRDIPIVIGVPWRNTDSWREFAGGLAREVRAEELERLGSDVLVQWLGRSPPVRTQTRNAVTRQWVQE